MALANTLTTELDGVNLLLASIGEAPVNSIVGNPSVDVANAHAQLSVTSRAVQTGNYEFNKEYAVVLPRTTTGEIPVGANVLRVNPLPTSGCIAITQRGTRLYNQTDRSYRFDADVTADLTILLPFDELPEAARWYIGVAASRQFQTNWVGSGTLHQFSQEDEMSARMLLKEFDATTRRPNMLDNYSAARILTSRSRR